LYSATSSPFPLRTGGIYALNSTDEQQLIEINQSYSSLCKSSNGVLLIEILELSLPPDLRDTQGDRVFPISWAFLSLGSSETIGYTRKKIRLQLYKFRKRINRSRRRLKIQGFTDGIPDVYFQWTSSRKKNYPSTIYITFIGPSSKVFEEPELESFAAETTLTSRLLSDSKVLQQTLNEKERVTTNKMIVDDRRIDTSTRGCLILKYSKDGNYLACGCTDSVMFPLLVYNKNNSCVAKYNGHHDLIYDMDWSTNNEQIITASSDGTAKVWRFSSTKVDSGNAFRSFQHTCFVYSVRFSFENRYEISFISIHSNCPL
jgi:jouberin